MAGAIRIREVSSGSIRVENGYAEVEVSGECALLDGFKDHAGSPPRLDVWMSHGDRVTELPEGFTPHKRVQQLLDRNGDLEDRINDVEMLDGFLSALVVGPSLGHLDYPVSRGIKARGTW